MMRKSRLLQKALDRRKGELARSLFGSPRKSQRVAPARQRPGRDGVGRNLLALPDSSEAELDAKLRSNEKLPDGNSRVVLNSPFE